MTTQYHRSTERALTDLVQFEALTFVIKFIKPNCRRTFNAYLLDTSDYVFVCAVCGGCGGGVCACVCMCVRVCACVYVLMLHK